MRVDRRPAVVYIHPVDVRIGHIFEFYAFFYCTITILKHVSYKATQSITVLVIS